MRHLHLPLKVNLFNLISLLGSLFGILDFDKTRLSQEVDYGIKILLFYQFGIL